MGTQRPEHARTSIDEIAIPFTTKQAPRPAEHVPHRAVIAPRMIRGLLLEAGDILYDDTDWRRWLLRLLTRLGMRAEYGPFFRVLDRDFLDDVYCGRKTFDEALHAYLISAGLSAGQTDEACRALDSYRRHSEHDYRPLIGVRETIAALGTAGVKLGLLCNSERSGELLRQRLSELIGVSPWTAVVSSRDLSCAMPDPACYRAALAAMGLPAGDVAFVGRDPRELRGAKRRA